jgi:hypothetical protein
MAPNLDQWLGKHHRIRDSIIWEYSTQLPGSFSLQRAQPYKNWPEREKGALQTAFDAAWNLSSIEVDDLPANVLHPADDHSPTTALSRADAHALYLASVGQSLAVEIGNRVGWSVADYSSGNLAVLFDSREFFVWSRAAHNGYQIQDTKGGYVVPASPDTMYGFLSDNDLIGPHRYQTIVRTLTWCHYNLHHFFGEHHTKIFQEVWQYRGEAPVLRTIQGTMDQANPSYGVRRWTAGCHGTAGFLRAILRTVNIPVVHEHQGGHALPHFSADGLHLSHGDDPYTQYTFADPPYSMSELLIDQSQFDEWFGSDVSDDVRKKHVGKRVMELAIQYLPTPMLHDYCNDQLAGKSHADGEVYAAFEWYGYTLAELEWQHHLWSRMDAKIASVGGCDHLDLPTVGAHRRR